MTLALYAANGTLLGVASRSLQSGHRLALELSELLDGARRRRARRCASISSLPIQMFGLLVTTGSGRSRPACPSKPSP